MSGPAPEPGPDGARPPGVTPEQEPPDTAAGRETEWTADHTASSRDMTPAVGARGGPGPWRSEDPGAPIGLAAPDFGDARWSFLYGAGDTEYAAATPAPGQIVEANRRMRDAPVTGLHGPFIKPPVWTWEVPLYFWVGGLASGTAFVATACDAAGDHDSARAARKLALGAVALAPPLLIADLGRPTRFLNMLRILKPRSPMNLGAWCLIAFSTTAAAGVGADLLKRPRAARGFGAATTLLGGYLGSYTGVLLATTAVPLWARSRTVLGPVFICTAAASGAAATRLMLVARGMSNEHPTQRALGHVETASIVAELALSELNRRRLHEIGDVMNQGRPGVLFRTAKFAVTAGVSTRLMARSRTPHVHNVASGLYLLGALAFRYAWVEGGKASAASHADVAAMGRGTDSLEDQTEVPRGARMESRARRPGRVGAVTRIWSEVVRRVSLAVERLLPF
jgi:formate-dependent nitrite reductase membrane component NrfD